MQITDMRKQAVAKHDAEHDGKWQGAKADGLQGGQARKAEGGDAKSGGKYKTRQAGRPGSRHREPQNGGCTRLRECDMSREPVQEQHDFEILWQLTYSILR